jgi:hypothetical protein
MLPLLLLSACLVVPYGPRPSTDPSAIPPDPVSFVPLQERVDRLLGEATETDRRDRLNELRELTLSMRGKDPVAQRTVYAALERLISIEERQRAMPLATPTEATQTFAPAGTIQEESLSSADPARAAAAATSALAAARAALAAEKYLEAHDLVGSTPGPDATKLRAEAADGWARVERERAGARFLAAKAMPAGDARTAALKEVRTALAAINARFPANSYARAIAEHLALVDAELK